MKKISFVVAMLSSAVVATPAISAPLFFNFAATDASNNVSFILDSDPTPVGVLYFQNAFRPVPAQTRSGLVDALIFFQPSEYTGGFGIRTLDTIYVITDGPQIYSGTLDKPVFSKGVFSLTSGASGFSGGTLTITDVAAAIPEPSTWLTMLVGFAMVGGAARYRRRTTKIAYA